jgi:hypothetical protein
MVLGPQKDYPGLYAPVWHVASTNNLIHFSLWRFRVPSPEMESGHEIIKKILKHLGLWGVKRKPKPRANAPPIDVFPAYDQLPAPAADYLIDPSYPVDLSGVV